LPVLLLLACQNKQGPALPAATGEKAPPAPAIPSLAELERAEPDAPLAQGAPTGTGTLRPRNVAALGPKETGLLTAIHVEEGDAVKKGTVLFRLDSAQAVLAVEQARAAVATVQVQLDAAQLDYDRTKALRERGSVPPDALDQAKSRLDAAKSSLQQAQAALGMAQRHSSNMVLTAPFDGVVTEKRMNVGETATLMPPSVVLVLQDIDSLELRARLPEAALKTVREGSEITVRFPSIDESRKVKVKRIAPTIDSRTRTIEVVADVDNRDHRLLSGMLVEVVYSTDGSPPQSATEPVQPNAPRAQSTKVEAPQ
jgi:RND family efflux transporter MFP subunit